MSFSSPDLPPAHIFSTEESHFSQSKILKDFPLTVEDVERLQEEILREFAIAMTAFKAKTFEQLTFDNTISAWNQMIDDLVLRATILTNAFLITSDKTIIEKAARAATKLHVKLTEALSDKDALSQILNYVEEALESSSMGSIKPSEKYVLSDLMKSITATWPARHPFAKRAQKLRVKLSKQQILPFTYEKGLAQEKTLPLDKTISILNWNVCFFNQSLSMLFGGVLPWQDRIDKIIGCLQSSGADIICLQEVFSQEAAMQLYQKLQKQYAHFYIKIGPKFYGFNAKTYGLSSGLFVASKYPLENPAFTPFNDKETPSYRGYGFFSATIRSNEKPIANIVTTHLQTGNTAKDLTYQNAQIERLVKAMRSDFLESIPSFLCGDINIERKSKMYSEKIAKDFINPYTDSDWTCCELRNFWWKAKQDPHQLQALGLFYKTTDYFLRLNPNPATEDSIKTISGRILPVNTLSSPQNALSDHQALLTSITYSCKK